MSPAERTALRTAEHKFATLGWDTLTEYERDLLTDWFDNELGA